MNINDFVKKIHKKVFKAIEYRQLFDIIDIINKYMYDQIINNNPIYIDKLGVITQTVTTSKKTWSRRQNKFVMSTPSKRIVFRPHYTFERLIFLKKKNLQKPTRPT